MTASGIAYAGRAMQFPSLTPRTTGGSADYPLRSIANRSARRSGPGATLTTISYRPATDVSTFFFCPSPRRAFGLKHLGANELHLVKRCFAGRGSARYDAFGLPIGTQGAFALGIDSP